MSTGPVNTVAMIGRAVKLYCSTDPDNTVLWKKYALGVEPLIIAADAVVPRELRDTYDILTPQPGEFNLQVFPVDLPLAGSYGCVGTDLKVRYAELLVIGKLDIIISHGLEIFDLSLGKR